MTQPRVDVATEVMVGEQTVNDWLRDQLLAPAPVEAPGRPQTTRRTKRTKRTQRTKHVAPPSVALTKGSLVKGALAKATITKGAVQKALLAIASKFIEAPLHLGRIPRRPPVFMKEFTGPVTDDWLGIDPVYVLPNDEWRAFRNAALNPSGVATFTGDALNTYVGIGAGRDTSSHEDQVAGLVGLIREQLEFEDAAEDIAIPISPEDTASIIAIGDGSQRELAIDKLKETYLSDYLYTEGLDEMLSPGEIKAERGHMVVVADYDDPDTMLLVWQPPRHDGNTHKARPRVAITELEIDEEGAAGTVHDGSRYGTTAITLDPNLALKVFTSHVDEIYYDKTLKAFRTIVKVDVVDQTEVFEP